MRICANCSAMDLAHTGQTDVGIVGLGDTGWSGHLVNCEVRLIVIGSLVSWTEVKSSLVKSIYPLVQFSRFWGDSVARIVAHLRCYGVTACMTSATIQRDAATARAKLLADALTQIGPLSLRGIAAALNARGIKTTTGRQWTAMSVSRVLQRLGIVTAYPLRKVRHSPLFSSEHGEWATPPALFAKLDHEFKFDTDVAASAANAKCRRYYTLTDDGLIQPWQGTVWVNPPFGRNIGQWVEKAYREAQTGSVVVMLLPARTDTSWWGSWVMMAAEIRLLSGRIRFGDAGNNAPFPSAIVVFKPGAHTLSLSSITI